MICTEHYDVVVAGSGSAGLTAAVVAAKAGLKVIVVEKSARFGGTSAWSGGGCWLPANPLMKSIGITDSMADAERYVTGVVGNHLRRDLLDAFLRESIAMLSMLEQTHVRFFARTPAPDWETGVEGSREGGRSLASPVYDGRLLGRAMLRQLERPLDSFNAPLGMMMSPLDYMHALKMLRSWQSCRHMIGVIGRYAVDLLRYGRGSRLVMGNALVARLLRSAMDCGVILWSESPGIRLEREGERISGLVVCPGGIEILLKASRGVVMATGGFSANASLRAAHYPSLANYQSMVAPGNIGDGVRMSEAVGAVLKSDNANPASYGVVSVLQIDGIIKARCLHFFTDLPKPGHIVVNQNGKRFGNEANLQLARQMLAKRANPAWIISDHRAVNKYGVGLVWPYAINLSKLHRLGYIIAGRTLQELALKIGVDPVALIETISRFNDQAAAGVDTDFQRGQSVLDRSLGDPLHQPYPSLGAVAVAPFYAVKVVIGDAGSVDGLMVDASARVLDASGRPIPGLYACGLDMNSIWAGTGIAAGMNHAHNMTFAYIAARALADDPSRGVSSGRKTMQPLENVTAAVASRTSH